MMKLGQSLSFAGDLNLSLGPTYNRYRHSLRGEFYEIHDFRFFAFDSAFFFFRESLSRVSRLLDWLFQSLSRFDL